MCSSDKVNLLFFADTHLGFDYPIRPRIDRRRRGTDFFDNFHRVLDHAAETEIDLLVHGGDLFFRSRVPSKIVDLAYGALFEFADKGIPVVIVPGNHERSRLPTSLYLSHPNIHVFVEPVTYNFQVRDARVSLPGFPFERTIRSRFSDILEQTGWESADGEIKLLCIHQAVEGARVGPADYTFRYGDDVIRFSDLPGGFHAILAGHIHRRQVLTGFDQAGESIRVIYPGSIERTSFAEMNEEKGFYVIGFTNSGDKGWRIDRLDFRTLPTRPMFDIIIDGDVRAANVESYLRKRIAGFEKDAVVRIKCGDGIRVETRERLTSGFLRTVFPSTMNFQFSGRFFQNSKGASK
jgi:DNA repair exonuclease SbcCD nuclease subunit